MATHDVTTGDPIPNYRFTEPGTVIPWGDAGNGSPDPGWAVTPITAFTPTPPTPNCTEAITILEEAEYELKALLKKTPATINIGPKCSQDYIEIALRSTQAALRALLKIGV